MAIHEESVFWTFVLIWRLSWMMCGCLQLCVYVSLSIDLVSWLMLLEASRLRWSWIITLRMLSSVEEMYFLTLAMHLANYVPSKMT